MSVEFVDVVPKAGEHRWYRLQKFDDRIAVKQ